LTALKNSIKKAPRLVAGLFRILATYFFFFVAFFFAGAFFFAAIVKSPPILIFSLRTIAHLLRASLLETFLNHVAKHFKAKIAGAILFSEVLTA
jgi:hypothetical protein